MKYAGSVALVRARQNNRRLLSFTEVMKSTGLRPMGKRKHDDQFDLYLQHCSTRHRWTAHAVFGVWPMQESMRQSANPSRYSQTSDDRMTSLAMTERAHSISDFVALARTDHLGRKLRARDYAWGEKHKLTPSILPAMP